MVKFIIIVAGTAKYGRSPKMNCGNSMFLQSEEHGDEFIFEGRELDRDEFNKINQKVISDIIQAKQVCGGLEARVVAIEVEEETEQRAAPTDQANPAKPELAVKRARNATRRTQRRPIEASLATGGG